MEFDCHYSLLNASGIALSRAQLPRHFIPSFGDWTARQLRDPTMALCEARVPATASGGDCACGDSARPFARAATAARRWPLACSHVVDAGDGVLGPLWYVCAALWAGTWHGTVFLSCLLDPAAFVAAGQHLGQLALLRAAPGPLRRCLRGGGRGSLKELQRGTAYADCGAAVAAVGARPSARAIRASYRVAFAARVIGRARRTRSHT